MPYFSHRTDQLLLKVSRPIRTNRMISIFLILIFQIVFNHMLFEMLGKGAICVSDCVWLGHGFRNIEFTCKLLFEILELLNKVDLAGETTESEAFGL